MSQGGNFPEPKNNADRIALKAAKLLDQDVWERVSDSAIWVRGIRIRLGSYSTAMSIEADPDSEADVLKSERVSDPIADVFKGAFDRAMARKRDTILLPKFAQISDDAWERVIAREARKAFFKSARRVFTFAVLGVVVIGGAGYGIASCSIAAERAQQEDLNQVNAYGFRKGDFVYDRRVTFPDDCAHNNHSTVQACRNSFETNEKAGRNWVDWNGG